MDDAGGSWFGFDDLFWLTLLVLFLSALIGALLRRFRRNGCLKLFDNFHVTYIHANGRTLWGDLYVSSQGVELIYDAPFTTGRGLVKSSHLVNSGEIASSLALCRTVHALTEEEKEQRVKQIQRTFSPGLARRFARKVRNLADMMRDAIGNSLSIFVGAMSGRLGAAMTSRKSDMSALGKTLAGTINAYEPLLERHIGKPVVVECANAPGAAEARTEYSGYLVEYTEQYVAVFSVEQEPEERLELALEESITTDEYRIELLDDRVTFHCLGPNALIIQDVVTDSFKGDFDVTLLPGCSLSVRVGPSRPVEVKGELTHELDLVCPRANAQVRFSSDVLSPKRDWRGVAPDSQELGAD